MTTVLQHLTSNLDHAEDMSSECKYAEAIQILQEIIQAQDDFSSDMMGKIKEKAIYQIGKIFVKLNCADEIASLLQSLQPFFERIPKAKTSKIVRHLIDVLAQIPNSDALMIKVCLDHINWASRDNHIILCQSLEFKLSQAYYKAKEYQLALSLISKLIHEIKRLDDKPMLVETYLLESKINHGLTNLGKAKASLSAARTCANTIYCPPNLQAELDIVSGILHCDENDYKTALSYFFEAFENYMHSLKERTIKVFVEASESSVLPPSVFGANQGKFNLSHHNETYDSNAMICDQPLADSMLPTSEAVPYEDTASPAVGNFKDRYYFDSSTRCLKYILLCKMMSDSPGDVQTLIDGKFALRYATRDLDAMRTISAAYSASSVKEFKAAIDMYKDEIHSDPLLNQHLTGLYDTLLEQNLLKLIESFSQVQIDHIASLIELPPLLLEKKLSQMILDKKLNGILDQGANCLIIFNEPPPTGIFHYTLENIAEMGKIVDNLYSKAKNLS